MHAVRWKIHVVPKTVTGHSSGSRLSQPAGPHGEGIHVASVARGQGGNHAHRVAGHGTRGVRVRAVFRAREGDILCHRKIEQGPGRGLRCQEADGRQ